MTDKVYSVWYLPHSRWTSNSYDGVKQDISKPFRLTLEEAEAWLNICIPPLDFEVREVLPDNTSAFVVKVYNVWNIRHGRWTDYDGQAVYYPKHLTLEAAKQLLYLIDPINKSGEFAIREVLPDNTSNPIATTGDAQPPPAKAVVDKPTAPPAFNFDHYNSIKSLPKTHW
jgi:hypothetical protein